MRTLFALILIVITSIATAQTETFDLTTYTPPPKRDGWKKEVKDNLISYTKTDNSKKTWCQIGIYRSTASKGSIDEDFESEWQILATTPYQIKEAPKSGDIQEAEGWKIKVGSGTFSFNNSDAQVILSVMSGYGRVVSIIAINNSQDYMPQIQSLLTSVSLSNPDKKLAVHTEIQQQETANTNSSIIGTWTKVASDQDAYHANNGASGYIQRQYIFDQNGTYRDIIKTFSFFSDIYLTKESGTYQVNGNSITLTPQKAVFETWSRKDGKDAWGKLLSTQNAALEKATYQFTIQYNQYIRETQLILQSGNATKRDGHFDQDNKWFYKLPTHDYDLIKLPN